MGDRGHNRHGPKRGELLCPFPGGWGRAAQSNTMWPGPRYISVLSGVFIHPAVWPQRTWAENWGCAPLGEGELRLHLTECRLS